MCTFCPRESRWYTTGHRRTIGNENNFRLLPSAQFSALSRRSFFWVPRPVSAPQPNYAAFFLLLPLLGRCAGQTQRSPRASLDPFSSTATDIQIPARDHLTAPQQEHWKNSTLAYGFSHFFLLFKNAPPPKKEKGGKLFP